eukprot:390959-Amorphochlora_amoeboformis.AAC.1
MSRAQCEYEAYGCRNRSGTCLDHQTRVATPGWIAKRCCEIGKLGTIGLRTRRNAAMVTDCSD